MDAPGRKDVDHLQLLSIFHYMVGAMMALWACFPIFHFVIGAALVAGKFGASKAGEPANTWLGWYFMMFAGSWMILGWALAICTFIAGWSLVKRRRYFFCLVVAGLMTIACMPFGTALGVSTIVVLMRPTVKESFGVT
jgi:hypothetical protein